MSARGFDIARRLEAYARENGFVARPAYYIAGSFNLRATDGTSVYSDEAHLWCEACATKLLAKAHALMRAEDREDHFICCTDAQVEDTCPHCMDCGETLEGSVSSYCVGEEVAHYAENPIRADDEINPRMAVEIAQILYAAPDDADVIAIGKSALTALDQTP